MSLEQLTPRTDYELKLDILIDQIKTTVSSFNTIAMRAGVRDMHPLNVLRLRDELVKGMEAAQADVANGQKDRNRVD